VLRRFCDPATNTVLIVIEARAWLIFHLLIPERGPPWSSTAMLATLRFQDAGCTPICATWISRCGTQRECMPFRSESQNPAGRPSCDKQTRRCTQACSPAGVFKAAPTRAEVSAEYEVSLSIQLLSSFPISSVRVAGSRHWQERGRSRFTA